MKAINTVHFAMIHLSSMNTNLQGNKIDNKKPICGHRLVQHLPGTHKEVAVSS